MVRFFVVVLAMTLIFTILGVISGGLLGGSIESDLSLVGTSEHGDEIVIEATPKGFSLAASEGDGHAAVSHSRLPENGAIAGRNQHISSNDLVIEWGISPGRSCALAGGGLGIILGLMAGLFVAISDQIVLGLRSKPAGGKRASGG